MLLLCSVLAVLAVTGTIACTSMLDGAWLAFALAPGFGDRFAPRQDVAREGRLQRASAASTHLEMFTEEIENSTMNSAISSVIMSA